MKIIERMRALLGFANLAEIKFKCDEAIDLSEEFATLETQLKAEKIRAKMWHTIKTRYLELIDATEAELKLTEKLLDNRSVIIKAIPQFPEHGDCLPYALSWIESSSAIREGYDNLMEAVHRLTNENAELKGQLFVMRSALREANSKIEK